eukprot:CAMPEP_0179299218 /NCGR_PEP_ID=MMETSP0797-20121207/46401_1 /TAXON_ID=47934 /ORGANISM="Dinophysis acuminata, Strain DAEP01" /LENGTH=136 /DNA_ID=CAMNT_0021008641 /DNA_START=108 /DNA_END=515 /DNA_ORIENTATION=-
MAAASQPTVVYYWIPGDDDEQDNPNAFEVMQRDAGGVRLRDIRARFPLPGGYHFRFRMKWESGYIWMDVTNDDSTVPISESGIFAKVLRLSWGGGVPASSPSRPAPAAAPALARDPAARPQAQASAPAPPAAAGKP